MVNQAMFEVMVDSWKERLPKIIEGYSKENIRNMDEIVYFGRLYLMMALD